MEAKDIVVAEVARQADFGMEPSWEDFVIAGQEAGIQEVVKFANHFAGIKHNPEWKAQKKEWGL